MLLHVILWSSPVYNDDLNLIFKVLIMRGWNILWFSGHLKKAKKL